MSDAMGGREGTSTADPAPGGNDPGARPVVYCVVPADLAAESAHELLRKHFRDDAGVEVIVERRGAERRAGGERRRAEGEPPAGERREIRARTGRRVGERRAAQVPLARPPELPRRLRRHADRILFVRLMEPSSQQAEDRDTARLVMRFQRGERDAAFTKLYARYFDRVYSYMRAALRDHYEAEDATQDVFAQALKALPGYERREQPFRAWLFILARNQAVSTLRKLGKLTVEDPAELERRRERDTAEGAEDADEDGDLLLRGFDWLTDRDLSIFVDRLPQPQRQVLLLRYVADLSNKQIAEVMGKSAMEVGRLHYRAVTYLRERLASVGRGPLTDGIERVDSIRPLTHVNTLRARRYALIWRA